VGKKVAKLNINRNKFIINRKFKHTLFSFYHNILKRDKYEEQCKLLNESQYWSIEEIKSYQLEKLKSLLSYVYDNIKYYNNLFNITKFNPSELKSFEDFSNVEILNKEKISLNYEDLILKNILRKDYYSNSTSGSTGNNLKFLSDVNIIRTAMQQRCYNWMGVDFFDRKLSIWGAEWDVKNAKKLIKKVKGYYKGWKVLSGYNLSDTDIDSYYRLILAYKPKLLVSYPSILYEISKRFQKNKYHFSPDAIQIGGEKLFKNQRSFIEEIFETKIYDFYGARDMRMIAQECNKHEGLHIMSENIIVEVLDDNGNPVEEGEGDLVLTDLSNKIMPFIRYKIGDRAVITKKPCSCGRGLPLLKEIIGRSFEIIEFPNGNKVGGSFWTLLMRNEPNVKKFQIVQNLNNLITIKYVLENNHHNINKIKLIKNIHLYSGSKLNIRFLQSDEIPLAKSGKYNFVVKELA